MNAASEQGKLSSITKHKPPVIFSEPIPPRTLVYDGAVYKVSSIEELSKRYVDLMPGLKSLYAGLDWSLEPASKYGAQVERWEVVAPNYMEASFVPKAKYVGYVTAAEDSYVVVGRAPSDDGFETASFGAGPFLARTVE